MKKKIKSHNLFASTASVLGWTLTWAVMMFGWMAVGQPLTGEKTQGRVHMQLEDLKKLIQLDSRIPSAEAARAWNVSGLVQEELGSDSTLHVSMTSTDKSKLAQKVAQLEQKTEKQILKAEKEYADAVASIKGKRKDLQVQKLNSDNARVESDTSKRIFENLLEEANLSAMRDSKITDIKDQSLVTVVFKDSAAGTRHIESIAAGNSLLWHKNTSSIARN